MFGIVLIAMGAVFMVRADFGVSMVLALAYLLYRWLSNDGELKPLYESSSSIFKFPE